MSTVREEIANQIRQDNAGFDVVAFARSAPDNLGAGKVRVSVFREELTAAEPANVLTHKIRVELLVGGSISEASEVALEAALDGILLSLQRIDGVAWTTANRAVFDDKFIGYTVAAEATSANVYRSTILRERAS